MTRDMTSHAASPHCSRRQRNGEAHKARCIFSAKQGKLGKRTTGQKEAPRGACVFSGFCAKWRNSIGRKRRFIKVHKLTTEDKNRAVGFQEQVKLPKVYSCSHDDSTMVLHAVELLLFFSFVDPHFFSPTGVGNMIAIPMSDCANSNNQYLSHL